MPKDVLVVGGVVDLAKGKPVGDDRFTERIAVWNDVRGIEQPPVAECTHRAASVVCQHDLAGEDWLVQTSLRLGDEVAAQRLFDWAIGLDGSLAVREGENKLVEQRLFGRQVDRKDCVEYSGGHSVEPDDRHLVTEGDSQALVLRAATLVTAQLVPVQAVRTFDVVILPRASLLRNCRRNRQGGPPAEWFADPAAAIDQRESLAGGDEIAR